MRPFSNKRLSLLCSLAFIGFATRASADEADTHVHHGIELRKEHRDLDALEEFQAAYRATSSPATRAQIGLAEQALGQWIAAESDLEGALQSDDPWIARNKEALEQALGFVRQHLGWLEVDANVEGAEITVNGMPVGRAPLTRPVRVVVGRAAVHVQAEGFVAADRSVPIEASDHARERVELARRASEEVPSAHIALSPAAALPPRSEPVPATRWAGIALASAGAVALGVGGVFGIMTFADKSSRDGHCDAKTCDAEGLSLDRAARRDALVADVSVIAGVAAVGAGVGLLFLSSASPKSSAAGVHVVPSAGPREASLGVVGVW